MVDAAAPQQNLLFVEVAVPAGSISAVTNRGTTTARYPRSWPGSAQLRGRKPRHHDSLATEVGHGPDAASISASEGRGTTTA